MKESISNITDELQKLEIKCIHICLLFANGGISTAASAYGTSRAKFIRLMNTYDFNIENYKKPKPSPLGLMHLRGTLYDRLLVEVYKELKHNHWNRTETAEKLGVSIRTIRNYIRGLKERGFEVKNYNQS